MYYYGVKSRFFGLVLTHIVGICCEFDKMFYWRDPSERFDCSDGRCWSASQFYCPLENVWSVTSLESYTTSYAGNRIYYETKLLFSHRGSHADGKCELISMQQKLTSKILPQSMAAAYFSSQNAVGFFHTSLCWKKERGNSPASAQQCLYFLLCSFTRFLRCQFAYSCSR